MMDHIQGRNSYAICKVLCVIVSINIYLLAFKNNKVIYVGVGHGSQVY